MTVRDFLLPDLGEGLEEAEIVAWRVKVGQRVELNQVLVEVNTAKALVEVPSPWAGVIETLHASDGDVVRVGSPLITIRADEEEHAESGRSSVLVGYGVDREELRAAAPPPETLPGEEQEGVRATPPVRRLATELGVDLRTVFGTGPEGRITREDVLAAPAKAPKDQDVEVVQVRGTRRLVAEQMARSVREIPLVTTFLTLDATALQALRDRIELGGGPRIGPLPIVVRALAQICEAFPELNATFDAQRSEIRMYRRVHVGVATDTDRGLLVPVVRDAGSKGILEIAEEIARLAESARDGIISPGDMKGGTITVTNVGTFGAEFGTPIINYPEAAILALGVIEPRPLVVDGRVEVRRAGMLSLAFDHRLLDGAKAGRALKALVELLESPDGLGSLPK